MIINHKFEGSAACAPRGLNKNYVLPSNNNLHQRLLPSKVMTISYDEGSNRKSAYAIIPWFINMNRSSLESTNQTDNIKKYLYYKGDSIYIIPNSSDYKNNYNARKSYIEKTTYVEEKEKKANNHNITVFPIFSYNIFEGPIKIKLTSKDAENNIHDEFKPNSSFSNSIKFSRDNKIWNKFIFRYLPISVFNARSMLYNKIKLYSSISRFLIYFLPDRYSYP